MVRLHMLVIGRGGSGTAREMEPIWLVCTRTIKAEAEAEAEVEAEAKVARIMLSLLQ